MIGTTELYILISVKITFIFIQGHCYMRNQNVGVRFLGNFAANLDQNTYVATTCWFVEGHAKSILYK